MDLESMLHDQATKFVDAVMDALRSASIDELLGETSAARGPAHAVISPRTRGVRPAASNRETPATRGDRLARRTPEEIGEVVDRVVVLLKKHPDGLRSEQIQKELGLDKREVPRVLKQGIASRALKSKGQKRATTYSVGGGRPSGRSKSAPTKVKAKRAPAPKKAKAKRPSRKTSSKRAATTATADTKAA